MSTSFLLPGRLRIPGNILLVAGLAFLIARFYFGLKPEFLEIKVFALYSVYLDVKSMTIIQNQVAEELGGLLLLSGLFILAFTKEKIENEQISAIRLTSFFITAYSTFIFLALAIIFTYGLGFAYMMMINMILWLAVYTIVFRLLLYRTRRKRMIPSPVKTFE